LQETADLIVSMADKIDRNLQKKMGLYFCPPPKADPVEVNNNTEEIVGQDQALEQAKEGEPQTTTAPDSNARQTDAYCTVVKKVKKENLTPENMGEIILCQIPGISSTTAIAIMKHVNSSLIELIDLLEKDPKILENIKIGEEGGKQRKISKKNVENMKSFLCYKKSE
jgi:hypothetical protein